MGRQIIEQPNGKFCIFSSVVDNITYYDMTPEEIVELWSAESKEEIKKDVEKIIEQLRNKGKPYSQFTKTYPEMLNTIRVIHGSNKMREVRKLIEKP